MAIDDVRAMLASVHEYNVNLMTREIYLHGFYASGDGDVNEPGVEYRMANGFIKNLNFLNQLNHNDIVIHQHTVGGIWNSGMSIFDSLKNSVSKTIMIVYAQASSMSSITLQGASLRLLMPNTEFLVHDGTFGAEGTPTQVTSALRYCERTRKVGVQIYAERCINGEYFKKKKMNIKEVSKFIQNKILRNTDWYMDAREAISYGFADGIIGEDGYTISFKSAPKKRK